MRVLLVNPNFREKVSSISQVSVGPPLGLAYIAAILEKEGIEVSILDANALNLSEIEIFRKIMENNPDVVGFTAVTPTIDQIGRIALFIKKKNKKIITVLGGVHATLLPEETLKKYPAIDFIIKGEGENIFLNLLKVLRCPSEISRLQGIAFRKRGKVRINKDSEFNYNLDTLPFPARHLLPLSKYRSVDSNHFTTIIAMRGCPAGCIYCSVGLMFGRKIRKRTPLNVIHEMEECLTKYQHSYFAFLDDTFTYDKKWVRELCDNIISRGLSKKIKWSCLTRADCLDASILCKMQEAGCHKIEIGIESGAEEILSYIKKGVSLEKIKKAFRAAKRCGIVTMGFIILNFPIETKKTLEKTKKLLFEIEPDFLQVSYATPYPKTQLYSICKKERIILTDDFSDYIFLKKPIIKSEIDDIISVKKGLERAFYMRPSYLLKIAGMIVTGKINAFATFWAIKEGFKEII